MKRRERIPQKTMNPALAIVKELAELKNEMQAIGYRVVFLREVAMGAMLKIRQRGANNPQAEMPLIRLSMQVDTLSGVIRNCLGMPPEAERVFKSRINPKDLESQAEAVANKLLPIVILAGDMPIRAGGRIII